MPDNVSEFVIASNKANNRLFVGCGVGNQVRIYVGAHSDWAGVENADKKSENVFQLGSVDTSPTPDSGVACAHYISKRQIAGPLQIVSMLEGRGPLSTNPDPRFVTQGP